MPERAVAPWTLLLLALAGCSGNPEPSSLGQRPPNVPPEMADARPSKPTTTPEERAKIVADRLKEAEAATGRKDYTAAIEKLTEAIMTEPKDRKVHLEMARLHQAKSRAILKSNLNESYFTMLSAANYIRTSREYYPEQTAEEKALAAEIFFNVATLEAMPPRVDETSAALRDAIGAGFTDLDRIRNSPDWKKILADPQFKKTWEELDKKFPSKK